MIIADRMDHADKSPHTSKGNVMEDPKGRSKIIDIFYHQGRLDKKLLIVFLVINLIVFVNAVLHDPMIGYDARDHLKYVDALSKFRLVTPGESREFFSPPLPYALPALVLAFTGWKLFWIGKIAQILNVLLSLGVTYLVVKICKEIQPDSFSSFTALVFVGILPVYYKTFSQVRGEPYLVFFALLSFFYTLTIVIKKEYTFKNTILLGLAMSLSALSRQWGIFLFPGIFLVLAANWIRFPGVRIHAAKSILILLVLVFFMSGWFYATLHIRYGSVRAFNRTGKPSFSLRNQSRDFYIGLELDDVFNRPVRPNLPNLFFPIFYTEIWGDYLGYFTFYGYDSRGPEYINGLSVQKNLEKESPPTWFVTNYDRVEGYLGRVNVVSLFPSLLVLAAMIAAAVELLPWGQDIWHFTSRQVVNSFLLLSIWATMLGYMWFLIMYPNPGKGDTIKATYMLHIFPYLGLLFADLLGKIRRNAELVYWVIMVGLGLCFLHNLPASVTHYHFLRFL